MKKYLSYAVLCTFIVGILGYYAAGHRFDTPTRLPSSEKLMAVGLLDEISTRLEEKSSWQELCQTDLKSYYHSFLSMPIEENINSIPQSEMDALVEKSFQTRLALREKLRDFDMAAPGAPECWKDFRSLTRALRYFEDYLIEARMPSNATQDDYTTLDGVGSFYLKNPNYELVNAYSLKSGDVILSRGNAFVSALIARITDIPNQFSHISMVYKDPKGKLWTIESHIEIGAVVAPMINHIDERNSRTLVFRYKDPAVSHAAAEHIFKLVKAQQDTGKNVQYDFGMSLENPKRLFCSEVAYQAFWLDSKISIPRYKNKFNPKLLGFLQDLGLKLDEKSILTFETFAPGDIEFDTDFDLVAEWRNPAKMRLSRLRDALLSKEVEWMEELKYEFDPSLKIEAGSVAAWIARRTPIVKKKLENKFPLNMTPKQLRVNVTIEEVSALIENRILEIQKRTDHQLTYEELLKLTEDLRKEDDYLYRHKQPTLFHHRFHPKKGAAL